MAGCTRYNIVMQFVSDLQQVGGFLRFPPPIKETATIYRIQMVKIVIIRGCSFLKVRWTIYSAGFRKNEALCQLSYDAPYLGPEGGKPGGQAYMLRTFRNAFKFKIASHKLKSIVKKKMARRFTPLANGALCLSTSIKNNGQSGTDNIFQLITLSWLCCLVDNYSL